MQNYLKKIIRENFILGLVIGSIMLAGSIIYSLTIPNHYISRSILLPPEEMADSFRNPSSLSSTLGNISGLGNLLNSSSSNKILLLESIKSMDFLVNFYDSNDLIPFLLAFDKRNDDNEIVYDSKIYDGKNIIKESLRFNGSVSEEKIYKKALESIRIKEDPVRGIITLDVETRDREMSQSIHRLLLRDIDNFLRKKVKFEAGQKIKFLEDRLARYASEYEQENLVSILIKERIKLMNAELSDFYSFNVVDSPSFPEKKSKPRRTFIVLFAGLLYLVIMTLIISIRESNNRSS